MLQVFADGQIFGSAYGTKTPNVLALHGWARTHKDFQAVLASNDELGSELNAIAIDLPGFGASPIPQFAWGTPEYAQALLPVLDSMGPSVVVLGHSFGGRVALSLAKRYPDRIGGLVITGVPIVLRSGSTKRPPRLFRLARQMNRLNLLSDHKMEDFRQRYGSCDYRSASGVMREILVKVVAESYETHLASIQCPIRLVWGDDDSETPLAVAMQAASRWDHIELVVCHGAGHLTPLTIPNELRAAVKGMMN